MTTQAKGTSGGDTGGSHKQPEMSVPHKKKNSVLAYFLLPGIIPEIKELSRSKFGYLAYLMAMIYQIVRILPQNHPYTEPKNIGKFSVLQVIATAANHVTLDRKNIDQVIVFIAILAGLILMVLQFISFLFFLFMGSAWASPAESASLFTTQNPDTDIAFYMIREVFGLPEMFGTLQTQTGLHLALHKLFEFYNLAILFVAVLIFLYYIVVVVGETAQTGIPFGQRWSSIYAPFRLVIAIGLLVPLNWGFNGAQYMAFYAAQLGSSLATNGWLRFNTALVGSNPLGVENAALVAQPNNPDLTGLVEAVSVGLACREAYEIKKPGGQPENDTPTTADRIIKPYIVNSADIALEIGGSADWNAIVQELTNAQKKGHLSIYFGELNTGTDEYPGKSTPWCGEIKISFQVPDQTLLNATGDASPQKIQENYFHIVRWLWADPELGQLGMRMARGHAIELRPCDILDALPGDCTISYIPPSIFKKDEIQEIDTILTQEMDAVFTALRGQIEYEIEDEVLLTGWGGAGIWYNKIAQANGAFVTAIQNIPHIEKRPIVMEKISEDKQKGSGAYVDCKAYEANLADNEPVQHKAGETDAYYAAVFNETYQYWRCDRSGNASNYFWDSIQAVFGLSGLFNLRQERGVDGQTLRTHIHPLAKLSSVGKSLVESAIQSMGLAMASSFGGGMLGVLSPNMGAGLQAASSMFVSIATIGLSVGFILYYILPFLPFLYFFFAVGGWVKGIFEAMVGTPLWALAHLRIDGEGLPGKSAMSGYLLIFEIFLRPILTVFGLIGGLAIFTAMATILNDLFDLAVNNVTGTNITPGNPDGFGDENETFGRHLVDQFFFTIVYAIILYMMALSSFKMITLVPNNILRWLGQSVSTFNDSAEDPAGGLTQYAAMGGARIGGQLAGGMTQLSSGAGSLVGEVGGLGKMGQTGVGAASKA